MRALLSGLAALMALLLAACSQTPGEMGAWRPAPITTAPEPSKTIADAPSDAWRPVDPENLLLMDLRDGSRIVIELAPDFAPVHVANIRALARAGYWSGAAIYRVHDNYVVQWGLNETEKPLPAGVEKAPPAEYDRPLAGLAIRALGYPDSYAPSAGHANGWPVGFDPERGRAWLAHCYGSVGVGRDLAPDTGMGGELYAVIGHAPRQLDRNIASVGRVIEGMPFLSARKRGTGDLGFYKDRSEDIPIARSQLASDIPASERPRYEVMRSDHPAFAAYVTGRANRNNDFYKLQAGGIDLCNAPVPTRTAR